MSVVSGVRTSKPASVISSRRNGGSPSVISKDQISVAAENKSKSLPFNTVTIPSNAGKGKVLGDQELTEEELAHLTDVCRRYDNLLRQEDERIRLVCMILTLLIIILFYYYYRIYIPLSCSY